jgi:hypothetical protein
MTFISRRLLLICIIQAATMLSTCGVVDSFIGTQQNVLRGRKTHVENRSRDLSELMAGGPPKDGIPAIAYTLFSFECCVRAASVLGFIGAGGIGYEINLSMRLFEYRQVLTLIVAFIILVGVADALSRFFRRRLRADAPSGSRSQFTPR